MRRRGQATKLAGGEAFKVAHYRRDEVILSCAWKTEISPIAGRAWSLVYQQLFGPIPVGSLPRSSRWARRY